MNTLASTALAALGVSEADHQLGWKDVSVTMADGTTQLVRLRRFQTQDCAAAALTQYSQLRDARPMLAQMLCGPGTMTFFDSLATGELARLANTAVALLFSMETLEKLVAAEVRKLTPQAIDELISEAATCLDDEGVSREGGIHA